MKESRKVKIKALDLIDEIEKEFKDTRDVEIIKLTSNIRECVLKIYMYNILTGKLIEVEDSEVEKLKELLGNMYISGVNYDICLKLSSFIDELIVRKQMALYFKYRNRGFEIQRKKLSKDFLIIYKDALLCTPPVLTLYIRSSKINISEGV